MPHFFFAVASGNVDADMKDYKHWCQYRYMRFFFFATDMKDEKKEMV